MSLSLCMITKNEEKFLEACLNSVKDLVEEIIIVDTGSNDRTKEIARKFTSKVFDFKWCDDFSTARNESLSKATNEWILVLDADEFLERNDCDQIKTLLSNVPATVGGFSLIQRNYTNDSSAENWVSSLNDNHNKIANGWVPNPILRLFRKGVVYNGVVHETVTDSVSKIGQIGVSKLIIHHLGHLNKEVLEHKQDFYGELLLRKAEQQQSYGPYFELAIHHSSKNNLSLAMNYIKKSISLKDNFYKSWFVLGNLYTIKKDFVEAKNALKKSLELNSKNPSSYLVLGKIYLISKDYLMAEDCFIKTIMLNPKNAEAHFNLGLCFKSQGKENKAYLAFKNAINLNPCYNSQIEFK